jgi:hypothetical protein
MDEKNKKLLDFLLADFNATKSEISRRSNLQKWILAVLFTFYAWMFQYSLKNNMNLSLVISSWTVALLVFRFYRRENSEIKRLGNIIEKEIGKSVSEKLDCKKKDVFPSQSFIDKSNESLWRKIDSFIFDIIVYFSVPMYLSYLYYSLPQCINVCLNFIDKTL